MKTFSKVWLALFVVLLLGCGNTVSNYQKSYNTLSVTKETAVFLASTAKDLHFSGVVDDIQLSKIRDMYNRMSKAQDLLINAQVEAVESPDEEGANRIEALTSIYLRIMTEFVNLAIEIGLIESGDSRIGIGIRPTPYNPDI